MPIESTSPRHREAGSNGIPGLSAWNTRESERERMIFYFSATGNSLHVAKQLAAPNERLIFIPDAIGTKGSGKYMTAPRPTHPASSASEYTTARRAAPATSQSSKAASAVACAPRNAPVHAIEMQRKHPIWVKDRCVMCLGCLHRCPTFAIQCGPNTKRHGQYLHP